MGALLITGATGNIGSEVIRYLYESHTSACVFAGVRDPKKAERKFEKYPDLAYRMFDFEDASTFKTAFSEIDVLFLLRPPQLSDVDRYFKPLLRQANHCKIRKIIFLSVQGVEKSPVIPHHKIESLIEQLEFDHIFVRPSYFMQNLTTTFLPEIQSKQQITLPAGKAKFNWVDVENIGEAVAELLLDHDHHKNQSIEITGTENKDFAEVAELMSSVTEVAIRYKSVNPIRFYFLKRREGVSKGLALVMLLLHFLPRFQHSPRISDNYRKLTGRKPTTLEEFLEREKEKIIHPA